MESHCEPYRDEVDYDENGGGGDESPAPAAAVAGVFHENEFPSSSSPSKMKPMSVSTGPDYSFGYDTNYYRDSNRKAMVATVTSVVFLAIGWFLSSEYRDSVVSHSKAADPCRGLNAAYFADLMNRTQHAVVEDDLCTPTSKLDSCHCLNPFAPREGVGGWLKVMDMNIQNLQKTYPDLQPDVVIYGDSITEHMLGRNSGKYSSNYEELAQVTNTILTKQGGGKINGLPMGVSGDEIPHLLYRLQNGEMPDTLRPKVWWILIGTNDLRLGCSADTIVAGNLRIVQEIRDRHNNSYDGQQQQLNKNASSSSVATIVVNSILPRGRQALSSSGNQQWGILRQVNQQLECYAQITRGVSFVNVTDIFVERDVLLGGLVVNKTLFERDHVHPNAEGSRLWEELIVETVFDLTI